MTCNRNELDLNICYRFPIPVDYTWMAVKYPPTYRQGERGTAEDREG